VLDERSGQGGPFQLMEALPDTSQTWPCVQLAEPMSDAKGWRCPTGTSTRPGWTGLRRLPHR
jgi:hypothetical protein